MKKHDLKKLAMLGLTGGVLLSAQSANAEETTSTTAENTIASYGQHSCGGSSSCAHRNQQRSGGSCASNQQRGGSSCAGSQKWSQQRQQQQQQQQQPQRGAQLTEQELLERLNEQGRQVYQSLDSDGKALALRLASKTCGGGSCGGAYTNKNVAVNEAARLMSEKRNKTSGQY